MNYVLDTLNAIWFDSVESAKLRLDHIYEVASEYGCVRLADVKELAGIVGNYRDNHIYWVRSVVENHARIEQQGGHYTIYLPDQYIDENKNTSSIEQPASEAYDAVCDTRSVHINVTISDMDDPDCILGSVFKHAREFRDRDVFINVY